MIDSLNRWRFNRNIKTRKKLYSKLSKMLSNSVPIKDALIELRSRRIEQFSQKDLEAVAIENFIQRISKGSSFGESLSGWVPADEQNVIAGGEQSGRVSETLQDLIDILNAKTQLKATIVKAITYPSIIITISLLILAGFGGYLLPFYEEIAPDIVWHGMADTVVNVTKFFYSYLLFIALGLGALAFLFFSTMNSWVGGLRTKLDHFGPYGIFSMFQGVSWLIAFSSLIQAGVSVKIALQQTSMYAKPWLKARINAIYRRIGDYDLGGAMMASEYKFPNKEIINDLSTYARFSGFDTALKSLADEWLKESIDEIGRKVFILNTLGLIFAAGIVIFIAVGMSSMSSQMQDFLSNGF